MWLKPGITRILKWIGASLCVLLAILWCISTARWMGWDGGKWDIYIGSGRGAIVYMGHITHPGRGLYFEANPGARPIIWRFDLKRFPQDQEYLLAVPLWMLLLPLLALTVSAWWIDRSRVRPNQCRRCGYDLTGNVSGRCPECGELR